MTDAHEKPADPHAPQAPHPGVPAMPRWNVGELADAPVFRLRNWFALLGPGLLSGGAAIGGGEWLMGPAVTARYGGALMWLATLSILGQVLYNIEISRYTLYTGEPIFSGKFRLLPGPAFWLLFYLAVDFGSIFPYLASNAATPIAAVWLGRLPDPKIPGDLRLLNVLPYFVYVLCFVPLIFGGTVYRSLKAVMTFKIVVVLGFLTTVSLFYVSAESWRDVWRGFVRFGTVPVNAPEDRDKDGELGPGEVDWDKDCRADVVEPLFAPRVRTEHDAQLAPVEKDAERAVVGFDMNRDEQDDVFVRVSSEPHPTLWWPDFDGDGRPDPRVLLDADHDPEKRLEFGISRGAEGPWSDAAFVFVDTDGNGLPETVFLDLDRDGFRDGDSVANVFVEIAEGRGLPDVDLSMIAFLAAFTAIAGSGGLTNAAISNYTRDQGWGMGKSVGAIPSLVGGRSVTLSHVGTVFVPDAESLVRWKRWIRHVCRDQLAVWMPACFLGIAIPSLLSVEFIRRGTVADDWTMAGMTADGVLAAVASRTGLGLGQFCWYMTLFCGFLTLAPTMTSTADGFIRRWVDVIWTASPRLRKADTSRIRHVYFGVLVGYCLLGLVLLSLRKPTQLVLLATTMYNYAFGFSCWHTMFVNRLLLPRELRPSWIVTGLLLLCGTFFLALAVLSTLKTLGLV